MKDCLLLFVAALFFFSACGKSDSKNEAAPPPAQKAGGSFNVVAVEGFVAKPSQLTESVTASGALLPAEETELHPEASGRVVSLNLPEGTSITETQRMTQALSDEVGKIKEVAFVNPYIHEGIMSHSHLYVRLVDIRKRSRSNMDVAQDIRKVSLWLGHSTLATTEIYVRSDPSQKLEAIEAIVPPHLRKGKFRPPDRLIAMLRTKS